MTIYLYWVFFNFVALWFLVIYDYLVNDARYEPAHYLEMLLYIALSWLIDIFILFVLILSYIKEKYFNNKELWHK